MNKIALLMVLMPEMVSSQVAEADSTAVRSLDEVTVTAVLARADAMRTVYLPDSRQRASATDGISLLAMMKLPQVSVNPLTGSVKSLDNQDVSFFINGSKATAEDVSGLNPADVLRVEYMNYPTDARFLGERYVVDFIVRRYAFGGYAKAEAEEHFIVRSGEASVYSKLARGKMEYDVMCSGAYDYNPHVGSSVAETFRFPAGEIRRLSVTESSRNRQADVFVGVRASWLPTDSFALRSRVAFQRSDVFRRALSGTVAFSEYFPPSDFSELSPSRGDALTWESELVATMNGGWAVAADIDATLRRNRATFDYSTDKEHILNFADEKGWTVIGNLRASRVMSEHLSLFMNLRSSGGVTRINYGGDSPAKNIFRPFFTGPALGASLNLKHLAGSADVGYACEISSINGSRHTEGYPFFHADLQYAPNEHHAFSLWSQFAAFSPDASMKNPNMTRQSELLFIGGNPDLRCARHVSANVSYTWLPEDRWQLSVYAIFFRISNRQTAVYTPDGPQGLMLKRYQNDGNYNHGQFGARLTGKFFQGRLSASVAPRLLLYHITGSNGAEHYPFMVSLSADYYLGEFFFSGYYSMKQSYVDGETCYLRRFPSEYSLGAGWAHKGWNVKLSARNFFRSSWDSSRESISSRWYDAMLTQSGADSHSCLTLTVTYTVGYGRKVSQTGEMEQTGAVSSSILR